MKDEDRELRKLRTELERDKAMRKEVEDISVFFLTIFFITVGITAIAILVTAIVVQSSPKDCVAIERQCQ